MLTHTTKILEKDKVIHHTILEDGKCLRYSKVLEKWCDDAAFRSYFSAILKDAPFEAYFWETPALTSSKLERPFEFVLVKSTNLAGLSPDTRSFAQFFRSNSVKNDIVTFPNLGKNAMLVVPCPISSLGIYPHLATFIRGAETEQAHAFWQAVGAAMKNRISTKPVWLSTSGLGVHWLHVRLDDRPKYYQYPPYRRA